MFNKEEKPTSKFKENLKANRAVYITVLSILLVLIVIVSLVAVANNRKATPGTETPSTTTTKPTPVEPEPEEPSDDVDGKLPVFTLPVSGKLLKGHDEELQVYSTTMGDYRVHLGIDILTEENAPVCAAADGKISAIWEDVRMGQCLAITHGGGAVSIYKNLSPDFPAGIAEGVSVKAGQRIGTVGTSAMVEIAEEPHLHYEMTVNNVEVDPLDYFAENVKATLSEDVTVID